MGRLVVSIATTDYDHFRDFRTGLVDAPGVEPQWSLLGHHEIFARFTARREWHVAELSLAKFTAQISREQPDIIGLPVICSRLFRFGSIYVNRRSGVREPTDLVGRQVGSPEWAHSAAVWMRGWLHNEAHVPLEAVRWVQAGVNNPGRQEKVELSLPPGVALTRVADRSLSDLLAAGDIDAAIIARPPQCFLDGHPDVVRMFPDFETVEADDYYRRGIWPIMHLIAVRRNLLAAHPWVGRNLYNAFCESKQRAVTRLLDPAVSRYPLPWLPAYAHRMTELMGGDPFPYGLERNRRTLETMLLYAWQQGIAHRQLQAEELFPPGIDDPVLV